MARLLGYVLLPLRLVLRVVIVGIVLYLFKGLIFVVIAILVGLWWALSRLLNLVFLPLTALLEGTRRAYPGFLRGALRWRWAVLPLAFGLFGAAVGVIPTLGTDLVPNLAQGEFAFRLKLPAGTPLHTTSEVLERVEALSLRRADTVRSALIECHRPGSQRRLRSHSFSSPKTQASAP